MDRRQALLLLAGSLVKWRTGDLACPDRQDCKSSIGLGTWQVSLTRELLSAFVRLGGRVIDTSPMYGNEATLGDLTTDLRPSLFLATKVWTTGKAAGIAQMEDSFRALRTRQIDLMQVHNLVDVDTHLPVLREWKRAGRIRNIGITHYESSAYPRVEEVLRREPLDFLQINYSIAEPEASQRLLPLAHERGVAVIANRPFAGGDLFRAVRSKPLPPWAAEFDCHSWAQFFLKWIVSDPRITCAIPGTNTVRYLEDNMRAGHGRLPDVAMRRRMAEYVR